MARSAYQRIARAAMLITLVAARIIAAAAIVYLLMNAFGAETSEAPVMAAALYLVIWIGGEISRRLPPRHDDQNEDAW